MELKDEPETSKEMKAELFRHFTPRYAVLTEISHVDVNAKYPAPANRICDVLLYKHDDRIAVEIKVSKADLLQDISDPTKQALWESVTHRLAFAVPLSLLELALERVPLKYGVLAVGKQPNYARVTWARRAPRIKGRTPDDMHPFTVAAVFTRCADAESKLKGHGFHDPLSDDVETLRAEVKRLTHELSLKTAEAARHREKARKLSIALSNVKPLPCEYCGLGLKPKRDGWGHWVHVDAEAESACRIPSESRWSRFRDPVPMFDQ